MSVAQPIVMNTGNDVPLAPADRIEALDILRGFAVMAIFIVNIKGMAMPFTYYMNGSLWATDVEQHIAVVQKFLVDDRWRTIFTVLFGAGMVLIGDKSDGNGLSGKSRLLTRNFWLMIFGAFHMILIWSGDILFLYAFAGFIAMWSRHKSVRSLTVWASIVLIVGTLWASALMMAPLFSAEAAAKMGSMMWGTDPEYLAKQIAIFQGPFAGHVASRASEAVGMVLFFMILGGFLAVTVGLMLAGMALFKSGFLRGTWSVGTYFVLAVIGLGVGSMIEFYSVRTIADSGYDFMAATRMMPLSYVDGYFGALGFAALILGVVRLGVTFGSVAAVGRMAFTNYILCSLIGTTLGGGHAWGFGWYGDVSLTTLMVVVGATFIGMLIWSPLWLSVFRFGPLEWLWRSLTYGKVQQLLR